MPPRKRPVLDWALRLHRTGPAVEIWARLSSAALTGPSVFFFMVARGLYPAA